MLVEVFLICIGLIWLIFASVEDLKKREVDNWVCFSLIIFALGFRFFYSLFFENFFEFNLFYEGFLGFAIFFVLGNVFYYSRVFGGGDAKLLMALGAVLFFTKDLFFDLTLVFVFLLLFFVVGSLYGLCWILYFILFYFKQCFIETKKVFFKNSRLFLAVSFFGLFFIFMGFVQVWFFAFAFFVFSFPFIFSFSKAVENLFMIKKVKTSLLREGDLLEKDVLIGKRKIKSSWEGLSQKDIDFLKKHKRFVSIKDGIPFVPVFLICFILFFFLLFYLQEHPLVFLRTFL